MDATRLGCLLLLLLIQTSVKAQSICSAPEQVNITENNAVGAVVLTINLLESVTVTVTSEPPENNPFVIDGNLLKVNAVLDFEGDQNVYVLQLNCRREATGDQLQITVAVIVINLNDNRPTFAQTSYSITVPEASPVDSTVGRFPATDLDNLGRLYYTLVSETNYFKLEGTTLPNILVNSVIDYDKVKNVQLILKAQDTPLGEEANSLTGTTTITVTISDFDNRPPWFQPCDKFELAGAVICQSNGYTGDLVLGEQQEGVLPLDPGPLYAIDGDSGINEKVAYTILKGNEANLFKIDPTTGNMSLLLPVNVLGPISLTVVAAQVANPYQISTTSVTFNVKAKTLNPPRFPKAQYTGVVVEVGAMATDPTNGNEPLKIFATDEDYAAVGSINPDITYQIIGSEDFSIINDYLFMDKLLLDGTLALQVRAVDTVSKETVTAPLTVQVKTGLTTTTVETTIITTIRPGTTPEEGVTTKKPGTTPEEGVTTKKPGTTPEEGVTTKKPGTTPEGGVTTKKPGTTPEGGVTTKKPGTTPEGGVTTKKPGTTPEGGVTTKKPGTTPEGGVTTKKPGTTPEGGVTTKKPGTTPEGGVTTKKPGTTPEEGITTKKPGTTPEGGVTTNKPGTTPEGGVTTKKPGTTPEGGVTTNKPGTTPEGGVTTNKPGTTPEGGVTTNKPGTTPEGGVTTNKPGTTPEGGVTTNKPGPTPDFTTPNGAIPTKPDTEKGPVYGPGDMAALGVTLGVMLLIALVAIGVLVCCIQKRKADWSKIYEAIVFKGALTPGSANKKGMQFTNHTFHSDEEKASDARTTTQITRFSEEPQKSNAEIPHNNNIATASVPLHDLLDGTGSQSGTENVEKEVKPILTKERRVDDGYKAVWFKTDIDPSANEEVVIIPDSREDNDDDETSFGGREAEDDNDSPRISSRVGFADSDHDSGLGVRFEDPGDFRDDAALTDSFRM